MKETKYELLVVIANQGYSNMIMDAAKRAGAGGGTVIHARGTGMERAESFLVYLWLLRRKLFLL